jgi:hypothetical protein
MNEDMRGNVGVTGNELIILLKGRQMVQHFRKTSDRIIQKKLG